MEITFCLPVRNARNYFDKDGVFKDIELHGYMSRYADAVTIKASKYYKERPEIAFRYQWDYGTLEGCYWRLLAPYALDENKVQEFDAMLPVLKLAESEVWDAQDFYF
jgi:hypothetical protein